ncbi:MAG: NTP transferase domain-containing protein, partial [Roseovarius sp.]|nr:NTP transferase domain-containing protein [Roseovarius sp.]
MADLVILLPAAGASARMEGPDKLLEPVDGMPLLRRQVLMALATGAPVLVTLPPGAAKRRAALAGLGDGKLAIREVPGASEGMGASIRAGAGWAGASGAARLMILLADLPDLETADLVGMCIAAARAPGTIWR